MKENAFGKKERIDEILPDCYLDDSDSTLIFEQLQ